MDLPSEVYINVITSQTKQHYGCGLFFFPVIKQKLETVTVIACNGHPLQVAGTTQTLLQALMRLALWERSMCLQCLYVATN